MSKNYKIKRYKQIYRRGPRPFHVAAAVIVVCVLAFLGWNIYGPVNDYLSGRLTASSPSSSTPEEETPAATPEPLPPEPTPEPLPNELHAVYLPVSFLNDPALLDSTLDSLSLTDTNAVLFDLKNSSGNVLYQSQLEQVQLAQSQSETAYDLAAVCEKLKAKNMVPIGRLNAFLDPIAAGRIPDAGVRYLNTEILWLDDSAEAGGKPWLNPYSAQAQAYIADLAREAVSMGVHRILLDNYSFPTGYGQEYANFGPNAATQTRADLLSSFIDTLDKQVSELGGECSLYISGIAALGVNNTYYGSNPLALSNGNVTLGVMPAQFGDAYTSESLTLEAPILHPGETVDALLKALAPDTAGMKLTALLQAYPASYLYQNNKMYTAEDINAQIGAAAANGIGSYIIYNPDGSYPAS